MAIDVTYIDDGGILLKGTGRLVFSDIDNANSVIYATHEKMKAIRYQLCDYSEVVEIEISAEQVETLANQDIEASKINPKMIIAVVGANDLIFGLLRMWEIYADDITFETKVFRDVMEARAWINERLET